MNKIIFCFLLVIIGLSDTIKAQIEIKPEIGSIEGKPDYKITNITLSKLNTTVTIELTGDRKLDNNFYISENDVKRTDNSIKEISSTIAEDKKIRIVNIVFPPIHGETRKINFFEDCDNCATYNDIKVFSIANLLQNPTPVANLKKGKPEDFTQDFKTYFNSRESKIEIAEGIWDLKMISASFHIFYSNVFGGLYDEKTNSNNLPVAIIKKPGDESYLIFRMDGGLLDMYLAPTASNSIFFLKKLGGSYNARTIFINPYLATVETFITKDIIDIEKTNEGNIESLGIELTKLFPTEGGRSESSKEIKKSGTGFIVSSDGTIATNYHVVEDGSSIIVTLNTKGVKKDYEAKVLYSDKPNDLALIKITDPAYKNGTGIPYHVKSVLLDIGSPVFTLGFPLTTYLGNEVKYTDGKVSSRTGYKGNIATYQLSVPLQPGNSGGPLFDWDGNIVGITNAMFTAADNITYAIKANYLVNLMDLLPKDNAKSIDILKDKTMSEKIVILSDYVVFIQVK